MKREVNSEMIYTITDKEGHKKQIRIPRRKDKIAAVIISAIFGGFGFWLYTYGKNKLKFWITFVIFCILPFVGFKGFEAAIFWWEIVWVWGFLESVIHPGEWYDLYYVEGEKNASE